MNEENKSTDDDVWGIEHTRNKRRDDNVWLTFNWMSKTLGDKGDKLFPVQTASKLSSSSYPIQYPCLT